MNPAVFNSSVFLFNKLIEENSVDIAKEALSLYYNNKFYHHIQSEQSGVEINKLAADWRVFNIKRPSLIEDTKHLIPLTYSIISSIPEIVNCKFGLCYFSIVPAGGKVKPHVSGLKINDRIRHQLCIKSPTTGESFIEINGQKCKWTDGKVITFDDAYTHYVENNSLEDRIVLIYDSDPI